jgi:hypothetical protein
MFKVSKSLRRSTAVLAVVLATFVASGSGAQAASLPEIANGVADSQALHLQIALPSVADLQNVLGAALGVDTSALPALPSAVQNLLSTVSNVDEVISLNHGEVMHGVTRTINHAQGFATPLSGTLDSVLKTLGLSGMTATSSCSANAGCTSNNGLSSVGQTAGGAVDATKPVVITLPAGLGTIKLAGAQSITKNLLDTTNYTGLVDVKLGLAGLFGPNGVLSALRPALTSLQTAINDQALPQVNSVLQTVETNVNGLLDNTALAPVIAPVKDELNKLVTIGDSINAIPDLTTADLLDLSILTANASVSKATGASGAIGVLSQSASKIANLDILKAAGKQGWAHVDAINLGTKAFADGVKSDAIAEATNNVVGGDLGGLLGIHISNADLVDLLNGTAVTSTLQKVLTNAGLDATSISSLMGAVNMLQNVIGIKVENVGTQVHKAAASAFAKAGTLRISVSPQVPVLSSLQSVLSTALSSQALPDFSKVKYVALGAKPLLSIELPNASSVSAMGKTFGVSLPTPHARTGVGTPFAVAFIMIGAAIVVRRFALAK